MAETDLRERLRLALSYAEKARHAGQPSHVRQAEAMERAARDALLTELARLGTKLRDALTGGQAESEAVARLRARVGELNHLARVDNAADAGGFIELPLDKYASRLGKRPQLFSIDVVPTRRGFILWLVLIVSAVAVAFLYSGWWAGGSALSIDVMPASGEAQAIVRLTNHSARDLAILVPAGSTDVAAWPPEVDGGMMVSVKTAGDKDFRPLPPIPECWELDGAALIEPRAITIPAQLFLDLTWVSEPLHSKGQDPTEIRYQVLTPSGKAMASAEMND